MIKSTLTIKSSSSDAETSQDESSLTTQNNNDAGDDTNTITEIPNNRDNEDDEFIDVTKYIIPTQAYVVAPSPSVSPKPSTAPTGHFLHDLAIGI